MREGSLIDLTSFCQEHNVTHRRAAVKSLSKTSATIQPIEVDTTTTTNVEFNVCVVATRAGSHWPGLGRDLPTSA